MTAQDGGPYEPLIQGASNAWHRSYLIALFALIRIRDVKGSKKRESIARQALARLAHELDGALYDRETRQQLKDNENEQ